MTRPAPTRGLRHVALLVRDLAACEHFYTEILGMRVEWRPDAENIYLTSGNDNLALHQAPANFQARKPDTLDHIGFIVASPEHVDAWYDFMLSQQVPIKTTPKTHRDGARSFYCADPDGNTVQIIYHPPIARV